MSKNNELLVKKRLIMNGDNSKYNELIKIYKYLLEYYINSKIDLSKYEKLIKDSGLYIGINSKYKSLNEYLTFDYIFLINNLFVEKLSFEDIDTLMTKFDKNNISSELMSIIERTYKDVIYDNFVKGEYRDIICKVCYGPAVPFNMVDNNALVFKIYYGKNLIDKDGSEFIELHERQLSFLHELIKELKKEIKEKLNVNSEVLLEKDIY